MKKLALLVLLSALLTGCLTSKALQNRSAGYVPCQPPDVKIVEKNNDLSGRVTWVAECRGVRYHCSCDGYGTHVMCSEEK